MTKLRLFTRSDCHLCDLAANLLQQAAPGVPVEPVNIDDDIDLLRRYGARVPVLKREDSGAELGWPFDAGHLLDFVGSPDA